MVLTTIVHTTLPSRRGTILGRALFGNRSPNSLKIIVFSAVIGVDAEHQRRFFCQLKRYKTYDSLPGYFFQLIRACSGGASRAGVLFFGCGMVRHHLTIPVFFSLPGHDMTSPPRTARPVTIRLA